MRAAARRRQFLESAAEVFAARGYRGATTAELARAAGVSEPILYRHFENKEDLFVTLIEEVGLEVIAQWKAMLEDVDDPHERLRILLAGNPATHTKGRRIYGVIFQAMTDIEHEQRIGRALRRHVRMLHTFLTRELGALQDRGVVRGDEAAGTLAWMMIDVAAGFGLITPLRMPGHTQRDRGDAQRLLEEVLTR